ncbi:hypothetical protein [uncultured Kordia sp.]|uniref:hypothetical protein n=1 Tax=uncultured Kordia sp. TaxID=507699 RepID=UPI002605CD23|nr:hypothetical protein [uncultured Kordia sp.]
MKKASLLLLIFISLTAFTCENEALDPETEETANANNNNNNNTDDPTSIIGTWQAVSFSANAEISVDVAGLPTTMMQSSGSNLNYTVTFNSDNTFATEGSYDVTSTVSVADITQTNTSSVTDVMGDGTYEITSNNTMTISGAFYDLQVDGIDTDALATSPQEAQFTISADGQTLTFQQDPQTITSVSQGIETTSVVSSNSVFTRQ